MKSRFKYSGMIILCLMVVSLKAQKQELECKKFEEGLYLNSMLGKSFSPQRFIDSIVGCMSESPKLHLTVGKYYFNSDQYKEAEKEYQQVISNTRATKKEIAEAYYYLGLSAYNTFKNNLCISYSLKALENGYYAAWVNHNIGLAYSKNGDQEEAIRYYRKALKDDPTYTNAINDIGICYDRMNKHDIALTYYYKADSIADGKKPLYASNIFRTLRELKRKEEAATYIKQVYPKFKDSKHILTDHAKVMDDEKKYEEVLVDARALYRLHPSTSDEWFNTAYAYFDGGALDTAFYAYNIAIKLDPKNMQAYSNLAIIYTQLGMYKESDAKVDMAFTLDSGSWYLYKRRYSNNVWQHKFDEAYKWARMMEARFTTAEKTFDFDLGWTLLNLKRYDEAIPYFKEALAKAPQDDRLLNNLGRCYTGLKMPDTAMAYITRAMNINPENSYIYHNRAALYCYLGKKDLACQDLKTALDKEYTWIIDENLEKMKQAYCPQVNTNRKIIIHEYKGNSQQLSRYSFIKLNDSLLNEAISDEILKNVSAGITKEEPDTRSVFDSYKVYPNPNQGSFYIEGVVEIPEPLTIKVFDENGKLVLKDSMATLKKQFSIKDPAGGLYVVMISNSSTVLSVKKMIIQSE